MRKKLTQAKIPMCPECGEHLAGTHYMSQLDWGWDCTVHGFVTTGQCNYGYYAPDVEELIRDMDQFVKDDCNAWPATISGWIARLRRQGTGLKVQEEKS